MNVLQLRHSHFDEGFGVNEVLTVDDCKLFEGRCIDPREKLKTMKTDPVN